LSTGVATRSATHDCSSRARTSTPRGTFVPACATSRPPGASVLTADWSSESDTSQSNAMPRMHPALNGSTFGRPQIDITASAFRLMTDIATNCESGDISRYDETEN
jgi:hypothetical protein